MKRAVAQPLQVRVDLFARTAVIVEDAIGFPAEVMLAHWAIVTAWGRNQESWLSGKSFSSAVLDNAKILKEASKGRDGVSEIAKCLDAWFDGVLRESESKQVQIASQRAREERS